MSDQHSTNSVAVITGASSGIGAATARALAGHGYRLALLGRRIDRLEELAAQLDVRAIAIAADVTDRDALITAADQVKQQLGGADMLVNNAGVMLLGPFGSTQREEARRMVEVNLLGAMTATEVFLDQLRDGGGDLVNISSVAGRTARAGNAAYAATKWGMNGWSEALRQELNPTSESPSSNPAPWPPNSPTTSPTRPPNRAPNSSTNSWPSPPRTSPRSLPSPSPAPAG